MKILLAASYFLYPSSNGGAQMCRRVATGLTNAGHEVVVSCIDFSEPRDIKYITQWMEQDGLRVFAIKPPKRRGGFEKPLWRMRLNSDLAKIALKLISKEKPDIIYVNASWEIPDFGFIGRKIGIPTVFHVHCFAHLCARQFLINGNGNICSGPETLNKCLNCLQTEHQLIRRLVEKFSNISFGKYLVQRIFGKARGSSFFLREALTEAMDYTNQLRNSVDAFIFTSELIADIHEKYDFPRKCFHILPHFLPDDRLIPSPQLKQYHSDRFKIGFFGRISPEKGFDLLINTLCEVEETIPNRFDLWIISRDSIPDNILPLLKKAGIIPERLKIFNTLTGTDLNPVLANLDVCVIPSICYEIGPLTMLETMAQGTPCIVSDSVGMSSLIKDGENGRLFPIGNAEALKDILIEVLNHPEAIEKYRKKLPKIIKEKEYIANLIHIFQSVIEK